MAEVFRSRLSNSAYSLRLSIAQWHAKSPIFVPMTFAGRGNVKAIAFVPHRSGGQG